MSSPKEFSIDVSRLIEKMKIAPSIFLRKFSLDLFSAVVMRTPVDTGMLRANWQPSLGSPSGSKEPRGSKNGSLALQKITAMAQSASWGTDLYLMNNLPYAVTVEYGGYPNPVKRGTYVPAGQTKYGIAGPGYVRRSAGGFSKQAPAGMVRVTIAEADKWVQEAIRSMDEPAQ